MGSCYSCGRRLPEQWPAGVCVACLHAQGPAQDAEASATPDPLRDFPESPDFKSRYHFTETLQEGGWSAPGIFRVQDHRLGRELCLYRWGRREVLRFAAGRRFVREAMLLGRWNHPGLMPVMDRGIDPGGLAFLTTTVWLRRSLAEVMRQRQEGLWKPPAAGRWWIEVLVKAGMTLEYLHGRRWIHAHLHPSQVFLGDGMEVVVGGLGLARPLGGGTSRTMSSASHPMEGERNDVTTWLEQGIEAEGTNLVSELPDYLPFAAPEVLRGSNGEIGPWTDVYAMGAMLYWMASNRYPFADELGKRPNLATQRRRVLAGDFAYGLEPATCQPPAIGRICARAMHVDPERRFRSARDLIAELETNAGTTRNQDDRRFGGWLKWFR